MKGVLNIALTVFVVACVGMLLLSVISRWVGVLAGMVPVQRGSGGGWRRGCEELYLRLLREPETIFAVSHSCIWNRVPDAHFVAFVPALCTPNEIFAARKYFNTNETSAV